MNSVPACWKPGKISRHQERLEYFARAPLGGEQVVSVAALRAPADDFETLAVGHMLGIAFLITHFLQELRGAHPENLGQSDDCFQARTDATGF
jgi:hypothetical protein